MTPTKVVLMCVIFLLALVDLGGYAIQRLSNQMMDEDSKSIFWAKEAVRRCDLEVQGRAGSDGKIDSQAAEFCRKAAAAVSQAEAEFTSGQMGEVQGDVVESRQDSRSAHDLLTCGKTSCGESGLDQTSNL